jgi:hypothetical protein
LTLYKSLNLHRSRAVLLQFIDIMKLQSILCLFGPVSYVFASASANGYQVVYLWYAYQLDIKQTTGWTSQFARGCIGTVPGGGCYFDEFARWIAYQSPKKGALPKWTGSTQIGTNLAPDVDDAATQLTNAGYKPTTSPYKLLPAQWPDSKTLPDLGFSVIFDPVMDRIATIRAALKNAGISEEPELE